MMPNTQHILMLADAYLEAERIRETALSSRLFSESKKLALLRGGTDITLTRYRTAIEWFAAHWPEQAQWPVSVPRPVAA